MNKHTIATVFIEALPNRIILEDFDYEKEWEKFCNKYNVKYNPITKKFNKPIYPVSKNIWIKSEKGFFNKEKNEKGFWQTQMIGWKLGYEKRNFCHICGKDLKEIRQKTRKKVYKFCSGSCRKEYHIIKKKTDQLGLGYWINWHTQIKNENHEIIKPPRNTMKISVQTKNGLKEIGTLSKKGRKLPANH